MKVTLLTKKDFANAGFEIVKALRNLGIDAEIISLYAPNFSAKGSNALRPGHYEKAKKRCYESNILHWIGDDPPAKYFFGKFLIPKKPTVFSAGGSRFRREGFSGYEAYPLDAYVADFKGAITPELCYKDFVWCPHVWNDFKYKFHKGSKFRIVHCPSTPAVKGTKHIREAIELLRDQRNDFDYIEATRLNHADCLKLKQSAHIYIDQVILPHYAMAAVEAMAYGIPTMARATIMSIKHPVLVPNGYDAASIAERLDAAMDWNYLKQLSLQTFDYCKQLHGRGGEMWLNIYKNVISNYHDTHTDTGIQSKIFARNTPGIQSSEMSEFLHKNRNRRLQRNSPDIGKGKR